MEDNKFEQQKLAHAQYYAELRSGKIFKVDEGFTQLFGYDKEDVNKGLRNTDILKDLDADKFAQELRNQFVVERKACYQHDAVSKDGREFKVCSFIELQNKLLNGHRVIIVDIADISNI